MGETVYLCLSDLLDQDVTSFEYFQTLPVKIRNKLLNRDITTFSELQDTAKMLLIKDL